MAFSDMTGEPESGLHRFSDMEGDQLEELVSHLFPVGLGIFWGQSTGLRGTTSLVAVLAGGRR
jgi:hypothetical protein